jgi:hypothetical protein
VTDPAAAPQIGLPQVLGALARRREHRRAAVAELRGAVVALARAVERHAARVDELRRALQARGGDPAALRSYDEFLARLRADVTAAGRSVAEGFEGAAGAAGSR